MKTAIICIVIAYFVVMNLIGLISMASDKKKARNQSRRTPEKVLFRYALLGGALGSWVGMYLFRHKTKHWYFVVGMPLILAVWVAILVFAKIKLL